MRVLIGDPDILLLDVPSNYLDVPAVEWLGLNHAQDSVGVAELDPPPGARKTWLADVAGRNSFAVLLFYRGFW